MSEMPLACEQQRHTVLVGSTDYLGVIARPPGSTTAVTPALASTSSPSRNGKNASLAAFESAARSPARETARSAAPMRDWSPAPTPTAVRLAATTTAFDLA